MTEHSALFLGHVLHRRARPRIHRLAYSMVSLLLDLEELDALSGRLRLFSRNAFNLYSFRDADHGDGSGKPLRMQVERLCATAGIELDGGPIRLLTMPRILGFVFNPLSVFFCHDRTDTLRAIIYEVNNTFGERHSYVIPVLDEAGTVHQNCDKRFHVSPFMPMDMRYSFRVTPPAERLKVAITVSDAIGPILVAVHSAQRHSLTDGALARALVSHPLQTAKVVVGILWEALKLWIKQVPIHRHQATTRYAATVTNLKGETTWT